MDFLLGVIVTIIGTVMSVVVIAEDALRQAMTNLSIGATEQSIIITVTAVLMLLAAFRLVGGLLAVLIAAFLILMMLHIVAPDLVPIAKHA